VGRRKLSVSHFDMTEGGGAGESPPSRRNARSPSISRFDVSEGGGAGGAGESPPLRRNMRGRVGGWQEAPL